MAFVKIKKVGYQKYRLPFAKPLETSLGTITGRSGFYICIESIAGVCGWGEVAPPEGLISGGNLDDSETEIKSAIKTISDINIGNTCQKIDQLLNEILPHCSAPVRFGIETALGDLISRTLGCSYSYWLNSRASRQVPVNYLLGAGAADDDWEQTKERLIAGRYRAIKLKVGARNLDGDIKHVEKIRSELGDKISIRLDANRVWSYEQAEKVLRKLAVFGIEYVEEPLRPTDFESLARLREKTGIDIALDESLPEIDDIGLALENNQCQVLVIKPSLHGSIRAVRNMIKLSEYFHCQAVITSYLETPIGWSALLHIAASLTGKVLPCGLDTLRLYREPLVTKFEVQNGMIAVPGEPGIGVEPDERNCS